MFLNDLIEIRTLAYNIRALSGTISFVPITTSFFYPTQPFEK